MEDTRASELVEEWAEMFKAIGNPTRFSILLVLYGSELTGEGHSIKFSELRDIMTLPNDSVLEYHLSKLIEVELVKKVPIQESPSSRFNTYYSVTPKWINFLKKVGLTEVLGQFIKERLKA